MIAGLGETGDAEDARPVRRWLTHPRSLGLVEAVPLLRDDSGAVTRQVVVALRHDLGVPAPGMLEALLSPGNAPHVRFAGHRLLIAGNACQRLVTNLRSHKNQGRIARKLYGLFTAGTPRRT